VNSLQSVWRRTCVVWGLTRAVPLMFLGAMLPVAALCDVLKPEPSYLYGDLNFVETHTFEVRSFPLMMTHPYEIEVLNTGPRQLVVCEISESEEGNGSGLPVGTGTIGLSPAGSDEVRVNRYTTRRGHTVRYQEIDFSRSNSNTVLYFQDKIPNATFRCAIADIPTG